MNAADEFRAAVESGDFVRGTALFADDIRFYSPVKFTPFEGIDMVRALFKVLARTFQDFATSATTPAPTSSARTARRSTRTSCISARSSTASGSTAST